MRIFGILIFVMIVNPTVAQTLSITNRISEIPSSIRGLSVVDDNVIWFSGSKGYVGLSIDGGTNWNYSQVKGFETLDFRSLYAFNSKHALVANAGSPAYILRTIDGGKSWNPVYQNNHADIFLDGMDFWDDKTGLIYGDPIDGRMMILKTKDGGSSWNEIRVVQRPTLETGEASFAASGTGIRCVNKNEVVIATGGRVSRLWYSSDNGENWTPKDVPIIQGQNTTGIFSVAINKNKWIVVGGDYQVDSLTSKHVLYSNDFGQVWKMPGNATQGYRSSVEFITNMICIAVGQGGIDFSIDGGLQWISGPDEKGLHVVRRARNGSKLFAAGNGKVSVFEIK